MILNRNLSLVITSIDLNVTCTREARNKYKIFHVKFGLKIEI
jgi:hypothetical protein